MPTERAYSTGFLPLLSRGKHRRPRKGACFMEFASYLAGERWGDHPACTHPLLAVLARHVNDYISDEARQALVGLVPDVIGLTGSDLRIDVRIALRAARTALPVVAEERQWAMATAVLTCERLMADLHSRPGTPMSQQSQDALAQVPGAATWAQRYTRNIAISRRAFRRQTAPAIVDYAVHGIAWACVPDPDPLLHDLLVGAIEDCRAWCLPDWPRSVADLRGEAAPGPRRTATPQPTQSPSGARQRRAVVVVPQRRAAVTRFVTRPTCDQSAQSAVVA
jgi:hypothetical protein